MPGTENRERALPRVDDALPGHISTWPLVSGLVFQNLENIIADRLMTVDVLKANSTWGISSRQKSSI